MENKSEPKPKQKKWAFDKKVGEILTAPVDKGEILVKPDSTGTIYLPHTFYTRILNKSFGVGGWILENEKVEEKGNDIGFYGNLIVEGRIVATAVGEATTGVGMGYFTAIESSSSDCLRRCAKHLGVSLELWDKDYVRKFLKEFAVMRKCVHAKKKEEKWLWRLNDDTFNYPWKEVDEQQAQQPKKKAPATKSAPKTQAQNNQWAEKDRSNLVNQIKEVFPGQPEENWLKAIMNPSKKSFHYTICINGMANCMLNSDEKKVSIYLDECSNNRIDSVETLRKMATSTNEFDQVAVIETYKIIKGHFREHMKARKAA